MRPPVSSRRSVRPLLAALLALAAACSGDVPTSPGTGTGARPDTTPTPPTPFTVPAIPREFRGMWIATVANIDWPSRSGLTIAQQQAELVTLFDVARQTGLNAVILHVRAAGDALYPSTLEPWSRSFTGTQGGDPGWDPLAFAVREARSRGLELHAWFNPFRAGNLSDTLRLAPSHFGVRRPDVMRRSCSQLWFDPGESAAQDQAIAVVKDVLARYDVDAVHLDDYFYPYPSGTCTAASFPDSVPYARYRSGGGTLGRDDWRRDNINRFVERLYREVRVASTQVRVGISPFGIWRPGNPPGITGLDSYASIYADSRLWLQRGWVDYFAPQLYWSTTSTGQNYGNLLSWWTQQNTMGRHLWPGLASYRINDGSTAPYAPTEIGAQVDAMRVQSRTAGGPSGVILYNASSVRTDRGGFASALRSGQFATLALPPATVWLDGTAPPAPTISVTAGTTARTVTITPSGTDAWWWLVRSRVGGSTWQSTLVPASARTVDVAPLTVDGIVVTAVDRAGNVSPDVTWRP